MRRSSHTFRTRREGFSLLELLIVIAIMSVLAGLVSGFVANAMREAYTSQCNHQLGQIAKAVIAYAQDKGHIPPTKDERSDLMWANLLVRGGYLDAENSSDLPEDERSRQPGVLMCPSTVNLRVDHGDAKGKWPDDDEPNGWYRMGNDNQTVDCSYYWNGVLFSGNLRNRSWDHFLWKFPSLAIPGDATQHELKGYRHSLGEIAARSQLAMVADGIWSNAWSTRAYFRCHIAARHYGYAGPRSATNVAFYDGHVATVQRIPDEDWAADQIWNNERLEAGGVKIGDQAASCFWRLDTLRRHAVQGDDEEEEEENP